jgi:hypothetical protein
MAQSCRDQLCGAYQLHGYLVKEKDKFNLIRGLQ